MVDQPYSDDMTAAHDFELPPHEDVLAVEVDAAVDGEVVYLTRGGKPVAAIVPAEIATVGAAAIEAMEDANDVATALVARDEPGDDIPAEQLWTELGV